HLFLYVASPQNDPMVTPSLTTLLNNIVIIQSNTTIRHDGRVQSYCGLRVRDIDVLCSGPVHLRTSKKPLRKVALTAADMLPYYPHLEEHCKCTTPSQIDDIIFAELPSPIHDPAGYQVVIEYMLHGPCGKDSRYAPCINDGKCSKHFPKSFLEETVLDEDGYPNYRRRDNKVTVVKGKFTYDNKHVVPHNRYLLLKYNAHINVEWCNRSNAIKYLFKYLNKGPDRATIIVEENIRSGTSLAPKQHEKQKQWKPMKQRKCIGKIVYSSPTSGERYYLIMLLNVVKGIEGFPQLVTVNNRLCATFKETCFAHGLLNDDKEWSLAIFEASQWALAPQLRDKFVIMMLFYDVSKPHKLWEDNWNALSKDIVHKKRKVFKYPDLQLTDEKIWNYLASSGIASLLLPGGRTAHSRFVIPLDLMENSTCVIPKSKRPDIVQACKNRSELWKCCKVFTLTRSMRVNEYLPNGDLDTSKQEFNIWVLAVGDGNMPANKDGEDKPTWIDIPEKFLITSWNSLIQRIIDETYLDFTTR
ncbi:ATP-dependent DNA helicase PIF1-like protein, partial [Tanacetum coccineum]